MISNPMPCKWWLRNDGLTESSPKMRQKIHHSHSLKAKTVKMASSRRSSLLGVSLNKTMIKEFRFENWLKNLSGWFKLKYLLLFNYFHNIMKLYQTIYLDIFSVFLLSDVKNTHNSHNSSLVISSWVVFCPWSCWLFFQVSEFDASQVSRLDVQRFGDLTKPWHRFNVLAFCRWNWRPAVQFLPGLFVGGERGYYVCSTAMLFQECGCFKFIK